MQAEIYGRGDYARIELTVPRDSFDAIRDWLEATGFHVKWPTIRPAGSLGTITLLPAPEEDDG